MSSGRTSWWAKDSAWLSGALVVELGEEFGPAGPLVLDALSAAAQTQDDVGRVRGSFRVLARTAFLPGGADQARSVVTFAADIGALADLQVDRGAYECRLPDWDAGQRVVRPSIPARIRSEVMARDRNRCVACGAIDNLELDHIHPWSRGGPDTAENLQVLCGPCNRAKGAL